VLYGMMGGTEDGKKKEERSKKLR